MNKFITIALLALLGIVGTATYWYIRPHHAPRFLSDLVPAGVEVPALKSPMTNFRPPQF